MACELAESYSPASRLLLMFVQTQKCFPHQPYSVLESAMGPKLFSQTVFSLLYRQ